MHSIDDGRQEAVNGFVMDVWSLEGTYRDVDVKVRFKFTCGYMELRNEFSV